MAAPITHLVITEKLFNKYFQKMDKKGFYVGTSFPDIRYFGIIERNKTHFEKIIFKDILNNDSFWAGIRFHSLVDKVCEEFIKNSKLYLLFPESKYFTQGIKIFGDIIFYKKINSWSKIIHYFDEVNKQELEFGIEKKNVIRWHIFLKQYLAQPPNISSGEFISVLGRPKEMSNEIIRVIKGVSDKNKATALFEDFYDQFEDLIK